MKTLKKKRGNPNVAAFKEKKWKPGQSGNPGGRPKKNSCFLGGIRGQLAGLTRLLFEEAAELTTGGFKGALLLLRVAVIQQRLFLLENIEDESFNWRFSQRRGFIQVADDFPAQYPEIVDVLADSFLGKIQPDEVLDEGSKVRHHLLTGGMSSAKPIQLRGHSSRSWQHTGSLACTTGMEWFTVEVFAIETTFTSPWN